MDRCLQNQHTQPATSRAFSFPRCQTLARTCGLFLQDMDTTPQELAEMWPVGLLPKAPQPDEYIQIDGKGTITLLTVESHQPRTE